MIKKLFGLGALALVLSAPALAQDAAPSLTKLRSTLVSAMQSQNWDTVITSSEAIIAQADKDPQAWHHMGYALHAKGDLEAALKAHITGAGLPRYGGTCAYNAACVYSLQGNADKAFEWLAVAKTKGFSDASTIQSDSDLTNIRGDARFDEFVKGLNGQAQAAAPKSSKPKYQLYAYPTKRTGFRVAYFSNNGSPGQVAIDHGVLAWKDEFDAGIASGKFDGQRWRLGKDFWTRLDTSFDLVVGGTSVPAGSYYLTLERTKEGAYNLAFNDPAKIRAMKLDPFMAQRSSGGIEVGLTYAALENKASTLSITMPMDKADQFAGKLAIQFGGHEVSAPVKVLQGGAGS